MLKKIGYFYLFTAASCLLLFLIDSVVGTETDAGFFIGAAGTMVLLFLFYTSPLWLLILVLLLAGDSLRNLLARAERFHAGNRQDTN